MTTVRDTLSQLTSRFEQAKVPNAKGSASWMVEIVLHVKPHELQLLRERELTQAEQDALEALAIRREKHEPLQYLFGCAPFYGHELHIQAPVFIPRPETEGLVEELIATLPKGAQVLELCTGPGTIAVTLSAHRPDVAVSATDRSKNACELAQKNACELGVASQVTVIQSDLFEHVPKGPYDALVANPPYIPNAFEKKMDQEVLNYEDHAALFSGEDGLDTFRHIASRAFEYVRPGGLLAFELEASNAKAAADALDKKAWQDIRVMNDMCNRPRFLFATRTGELC